MLPKASRLENERRRREELSAARRPSGTARRAAGKREGAALVGRLLAGLDPSPLCAGQPCDSWAVHIGGGRSASTPVQAIASTSSGTSTSLRAADCAGA